MTYFNRKLMKRDIPASATVEGVLVKLDDTADGMAEGFRRDGAPVGATAADIMVALNDGNAYSLFHQSHGGAFAARAGTNHYCIIIPRV